MKIQFGSIDCIPFDGRQLQSQQHYYHHVPTVNQRLLLQLIGS
jgi:hypothetical protein